MIADVDGDHYADVASMSVDEKFSFLCNIAGSLTPCLTKTIDDVSASSFHIAEYKGYGDKYLYLHLDTGDLEMFRIDIETDPAQSDFDYLNKTSSIIYDPLKAWVNDVDGDGRGDLAYQAGSSFEFKLASPTSSDLFVPKFYGGELPPSNLGLDISHARRIVHVLGTLRRASTNSQVSPYFFENFPAVAQYASSGAEQKFLNQINTNVFDGNYAEPRFSNFLSGSNGWYRSIYNRRIGFGYEPYDQSASIIQGGYTLLPGFNTELIESFCRMAPTNPAASGASVVHREAYYNQRQNWSRFQRSVTPWSTTTIGTNLQFLAGLANRQQDLFELDMCTSDCAFAYNEDGDGVDPAVDNCANHVNPDQIDTDMDGYGNRCDGDFNNDGVVNYLDFAELSTAVMHSGEVIDQDLNADGQVDFIDVQIFSELYLRSIGPSCVTN